MMSPLVAPVASGFGAASRARRDSPVGPWSFPPSGRRSLLPPCSAPALLSNAPRAVRRPVPSLPEIPSPYPVSQLLKELVRCCSVHRLPQEALVGPPSHVQPGFENPGSSVNSAARCPVIGCLLSAPPTAPQILNILSAGSLSCAPPVGRELNDGSTESGFGLHWPHWIETESVFSPKRTHACLFSTCATSHPENREGNE